MAKMKKVPCQKCEGKGRVWRLSRNLMNYYAMRSGPGFKGYTCKDTEAEVIAFMALMKMEEADNG